MDQPMQHNYLYTTDTTMKFTALFLGLAAATTGAVELTADNWDVETAGKTVFVKFLAPW
jgi:hypothetical protein